jgi:hypothetical protein
VFSFTPRSLYPLWKKLRYSLVGGWVSPKVGLGDVQREKNFTATETRTPTPSAPEPAAIPTALSQLPSTQSVIVLVLCRPTYVVPIWVHLKQFWRICPRLASKLMSGRWNSRLPPCVTLVLLNICQEIHTPTFHTSSKWNTSVSVYAPTSSRSQEGSKTQHTSRYGFP